MNELQLIQLLTKELHSNASVIRGAGDDCAVLDLGIPGQFLLFKTDAVVEGVHFTAETAPEKSGRKALARCLSDIAAMAGKPGSALVTLALPEQFQANRIEKIYQGLNALALQYDVAIAGGETTANRGGILISVAMLGTVGKEHIVYRNGAQTGDAIFVTGELGGSIQGRHLDFEPRLEQAAWLANNFSIHAMIDVSDGLASDLRHLTQASGKGAELRASAIPISPAAKSHGAKSSLSKPPLVAALTDGEDFELLFTAAARDAVKLLDAWKTKFPDLRLSCIGRVEDGTEIKLRDRNGIKTLSAHGFIHFNQPRGH